MAEVTGGAAAVLEDAQPAVLTETCEERGAQRDAAQEPPARSKRAPVSVESSPDQFKVKRFFVLRVESCQ